MTPNLLTTECPWCGNQYIKQSIGQKHGCEEEKSPGSHVVEAVEATVETVTIPTRRI